MPNLNQIYRLKQEFYQLNTNDISVRDYLEKTKAKDVIKKAFDSEILNESTRDIRTFSFVTENLNRKHTASYILPALVFRRFFDGKK